MSYRFDSSVPISWRCSKVLRSSSAAIGSSGSAARWCLAPSRDRRLGRHAGLRRTAIAYLKGPRTVPLLVHIYARYLGLTSLRLPTFSCASLALTIYSGAYVAEIVRRVQSVPKGQMAAGLASGLTPRQALCHIVYPQALRIVAPSLAGLSRSSSRTRPWPRSSRSGSCDLSGRRDRRHDLSDFRSLYRHLAHLFGCRHGGLQGTLLLLRGRAGMVSEPH